MLVCERCASDTDHNIRSQIIYLYDIMYEEYFLVFRKDAEGIAEDAQKQELSLLMVQ